MEVYSAANLTGCKPAQASQKPIGVEVAGASGAIPTKRPGTPLDKAAPPHVPHFGYKIRPPR